MRPSKLSIMTEWNNLPTADFAVAMERSAAPRLPAVERYSFSKTPPIHTSKWMCSLQLRLSRSAQYVCERRKCAESASPISCCWRRQGCSVLLSTEWRTKGGRTTGDRTISSVGQTRGSPNSQIHAVDLLRPRRHTTDLTLRPAPGPCSKEDLHTGGSYPTLMAFRIEKEKLAGEIFQLACGEWRVLQPALSITTNRLAKRRYRGTAR